MKQANLRLFFFLISLYFLLPPFTARAQDPTALQTSGFNYERAWQIVDSLSLEGLPRSAYLESEKIYDHARADRNAAMLVKAVIHRMLFQAYLEEDSFVKIVEGLQNDLSEASFPARQVLHSLLAETYWKYYERNRYRFFQRSTVTGAQGDDFRNWDYERLLKEVVLHYKHSLNERSRQQNTPISILNSVLEGDTVNRSVRPTLYDFLAQRATAFFTGEESNLTPRPGENYLLDDPALFSDASVFACFPLEGTDSLSLAANGLRQLQDLTRFHLKDTDISALVVVELQRLGYIYRKTQLPDKDSLYVQSLRALRQRAVNTPEYAEVAYVLARAISGNETGRRNNASVTSQPAGDEPDSSKYIRAAAICREAIGRYPESNGAANCRALLDHIYDKVLKVKAETINYPGEPFRLLIGYRNLPEVHLRIVRLWRNEVDSVTINYGSPPERERALKLLLSKEPVLKYNYRLPGHNDHYPHSAEAPIDPLPLGNYAVIASGSANFSDDSTLLAYTLVQVSALGTFQRARGLLEELYVTDLNTGEPTKGAKVLIYRQNRSSDPFDEKPERSLVTDVNGKASARLQKEERYRALVIAGNDTLEAMSNQWVWENRSSGNIRETKRAVFFTDRKVYRPGQTVHFKGFLFQSGEHARVLPDEAAEIDITGANGEEIAELHFRSNDFGTYSGSFVIPENALPGTMRIRSQYGATAIEVAEYKRPTFEVLLNPAEGLFRLNDSVPVTGRALSFAGYPVDAADVTYTVTRSERFRPWYRYIHPVQAPVQVASGRLETAADGTFVIVFPAKARDTSLSYSYEVTAHVTGPAGETQSGSQRITIGNKNLEVVMDIGETVFTGDSLSYQVSARNLDGETRQADITLRIHALRAPEHPLRERLWDTPDQFLMSRKKFKKTFPRDVYKHEDQYPYWETGKKCLETRLWVDSIGTMQLDQLAKCEPGYYLATVSAVTPTGEKATAKYYFNLLGDEPAVPQTIDQFFTVLRDSGAPGDTAEFLIGPAGPGFVLYETHSQGQVRSARWIKTSGRQERVLVPIPSDAGTHGLMVQFTMVNHDRVYNRRYSVQVRLPEEKLNIELLSFRDKARPGANEEWKVRISSDPGHEKAMAEMVATLYDASLDAIRKHSWPSHLFSAPSRYYQSVPVWNTTRFAGQSREFILREDAPPAAYYFRDQERLNDYGYSYYGGTNRLYHNYLASLSERRQQERLLNIWKENNERYNATVKEGSFVSGTVTGDDGNPLPGATIMVKGSNTGVSSNFRGEYQIKIPRNATLVFSFIGYLSQEVTPGDRERLNVQLEADEASLDEIVVVGFGQQKRANMVGSVSIRGVTGATPPPPLDGKSDKNKLSTDQEQLVPRANFAETAFFYPHLYTDEDGTLSLEFTLPESITRWKMLGFAHTKELVHGSIERELVTSKEVSVTANAPRFLRAGDRIAFSAKLVNLTQTPLNGHVRLELLNALTLEPVDSLLLEDAVQEFKLEGQSSKAVKWQLEVFPGLEALTYRVLASAGNYTDGEEKTLPVLPNQVLVTETQPLQVEAGETATFSIRDFPGFSSSSARPYRLTMEFTGNPAWYAVQSLPYLMEYPHECAEQLFSRIFANNLATTIMNSSPRIAAIFDRWKEAGSDALVSRLEKNQELKSALLEETPWVMAGSDQTERKKRLALLFDLNHMQQQSRSALRKLSRMQLSDGSFPWFRGMEGSPFITRHILAGMGQLRHLNAEPEKGTDRDAYAELLQRALRYADQAFTERYQRLLASDPETRDMDTDHLNASTIHFLYMRSFYPEMKPAAETQEALDFYLEQAGEYWQGQSLYEQGLLALALHRSGNEGAAQKIVRSLEDRALVSAEKGMYWAENRQGYFWNEAPIETQALLIEAFSEIGDGQPAAPSADGVSASPAAGSQKAVEQMKKWLLYNKRTSAWSTTKATVAACYALLLQGGDWLDATQSAAITVGGQGLDALKPELKKEAGTGYLKTAWNAAEVGPAFENIRITNPGKVASWGALYWQYFEKPENVPTSGEGLKISRTLYKEVSTGTGPVLTPLNEGEAVKPGDLIKVRLELSAERDYEFVHLKDLRAAALEPVEMLASYQFRDGLGYYQAPRDASMNFFIGRLPRGTYVLEYELRVTHTGTFSNGFAEVQCMYAPEFSARSEGRMLTVPAANRD